MLSQNLNTPKIIEPDICIMLFIMLQLRSEKYGMLHEWKLIEQSWLNVPLCVTGAVLIWFHGWHNLQMTCQGYTSEIIDTDLVCHVQKAYFKQQLLWFRISAACIALHGLLRQLWLWNHFGSSYQDCSVGGSMLDWDDIWLAMNPLAPGWCGDFN